MKEYAAFNVRNFLTKQSKNANDRCIIKHAQMTFLNNMSITTRIDILES